MILDVLVIGAGFAGVCTGIKLLEEGITNFRIVEKSGGIGGTWYENTYPGAACDVPSHFYCFSFEPNPGWSRVFAPQPEIRAYIERCVEKYGLRPYITHQKKVEKQIFNKDAGLWKTIFADGEEMISRHVISGSGGLHQPKLPAIPGREQFAGVSMHTARWNHTFDFAGKRVAVIGTAASAVQIIPELGQEAGALYVFQRTPNYVAPRNDRPFSETEKRWFRRLPFLSRLLWWIYFLGMDLRVFPIVKKESKAGLTAAEQVKEWMRDVVEDESLHAALTPNYRMGCKRMLISDNYYATLNRENVSLITDPIRAIDASGIQTEGGRYPVDAIVYATGFDLDKQFVSIDVRGMDGLCIGQAWADLPAAYRGVAVAGFPNYWFVTGPNTGVGTTSIVFMIEQAVRYILEAIRLAGPNRVIEVTAEAMAAYNADIQAGLRETVWTTGGCRSWYMREDGRIATLYPYDARTWKRQMRRVNREHFVISTPQKIAITA